MESPSLVGPANVPSIDGVKIGHALAHRICLSESTRFGLRLRENKSKRQALGTQGCLGQS